MARERKRSNNPEALRRRVLDVAAAAFQSGGYHSTSTHDIMHEAGVTGGALHHHFPTKKSLGLAVIRERVAPAVEETWIAPIRAARTAVEGIVDTFDAIAASLDERGRVLGCPLNNLALELSLADPDFQAAIGEIFDAWRKAISEKMRAEKTGSAMTSGAEDWGTFVVASYSGAMAMAKAHQSSEPLRTCARQLATLLANDRRRITRMRPALR
ncbi:transcriptional regulator, TetR family [Rhizobiales bacterium GAS191]|nr:transcriptional regulator, TetR family [Rhizobiales bacterium GAS113]SED76498.1 transcriptional regulator, TetR family [Rhizobiales bacterium GAS191]